MFSTAHCFRNVQRLPNHIPKLLRLLSLALRTRRDSHCGMRERERAREQSKSRMRARLIGADFFMSFMWVWSSIIIKILVFNVLRFRLDASGEVVKIGFSVINMFIFAYMTNLTKGGAYNPLTVLSGAITGDLTTFLFSVGARIPAQVFGSISGVRSIIAAFPQIGHGPRLNIDIHRGALTEGLLTFAIVIISLALARNIPRSFLMKTWISSISKLTLHILGSDLTGGCMNPAAVMGWAYARGEHITKEHIFVYWLAPIEATLLAVWTFKLVVQPLKEEEAKVKVKKSE